MRNSIKKLKIKKLNKALEDTVFDLKKNKLWRNDINNPHPTNEKYPTTYGKLWMDIEDNIDNKKNFAGSHPEETYIKGTEDNLYISDDSPTILVEPDVRKKLRDYYKKMGMI